MLSLPAPWLLDDASGPCSSSTIGLLASRGVRLESLELRLLPRDLHLIETSCAARINARLMVAKEAR